MAEKWEKNSRVYRLDLDKDKVDVATIEYALVPFQLSNG